MSTTADMIELNRMHVVIGFTMEGSYLFETRRSSSCDASEDGITTQLSKCMDEALLDLRQVQVKHGEETGGVFWKYDSILCTPAQEKKPRTRNAVNNSMSTEIRPSIKYLYLAPGLLKKKKKAGHFSSFFEIDFNRVFENIKNNLSTHMQCKTVFQLAPHRRIVHLQ